jgi:hypothetical protein
MIKDSGAAILLHEIRDDMDQLVAQFQPPTGIGPIARIRRLCNRVEAAMTLYEESITSASNSPIYHPGFGMANHLRGEYDEEYDEKSHTTTPSGK